MPGGVGTVQSAALQELTESIHQRELSVLSDIINLGYPRAGNREVETAAPCGSFAFLEDFSLLYLQAGLLSL